MNKETYENYGWISSDGKVDSIELIKKVARQIGE